MKQFSFLIIILCVLVSSCKKHETKISELPPGLIPADLDTILAQRLTTLLPSRKSCIVNHPILFSDTVLKKLILTRKSEVYVTFLEQSAFNQNTFGWYSYANGEKPAADKIKEQILFPNVTVPPLSNGDKIKVGSGTFPAGTVIEFFLIINGWKKGTIDYNALTFYTDPTLNPNNFQQHILFKDPQYGAIILGFEDILQSMGSQPSDDDFNDALFSISDNIQGYRTVSFDTTKMVVF